MKVELENCNNIIKASIDLYDNNLNIHFAVNGTGKSTLAKAIELQSNQNSLATLTPFANNGVPKVIISDPDAKVLVFSEDFVNTVVFKESDVIQNAFDVFIKSDEYEQQQKKLETQLKEIHIDINEDEDLSRLLNIGQTVLGKIKVTKKDELSNTGLIKSFATNESIFKLPEAIKKFQPLMDKEYKVNWVGWKNEGSNYDDANICPFCVTELGPQYEKEKEVFTSSYNKSNVKNIKELFGYFDAMEEYLDDNIKEELYRTIKKSENSLETLGWVRKFYDDLAYLVTKIKNVTGFNSFGVNNDDISNLDKKLLDLKIQTSILSIVKNDKVVKIISSINTKIDNLVHETELLKRALGHLKSLIGSSTKRSVIDINEFLQMAGIEYALEIEHQAEESARVLLKYIGRSSDNVEVKDIRNHLSWGERNAFALVLFMHYAVSQDCNVIVLDDPISSFDSNKKFAIMNRLFKNIKSGKTLYKRTVLMLTHDIQPLIDFIKVNKPSGDYVSASYLKNNAGIIEQLEIAEDDIKSLPVLLELDARDESINKIHRLACIRKLIEHTNSEPLDSVAYTLISSLMHGLENPLYLDDSPVEQEGLVDGENFIKSFISDFSYDNYITDVFSRSNLLALYESESNSYFQLQVFRVLVEIFNLRKKINDNPLIKFIDEQFHVENDYIFQLDYKKYDCVPEYIKTKCTTFLVTEGVIEST